MISITPTKATTTATTLRGVRRSRSSTAARISAKIVDVWLRTAAAAALVYLNPACQKSSDRNVASTAAGMLVRQCAAGLKAWSIAGFASSA